MSINIRRVEVILPGMSGKISIRPAAGQTGKKFLDLYLRAI